MGAPIRRGVQRRMGDDERRNERALPAGRGEGYEAREEDAGPVLAYGISASVIYGIILWVIQRTG